MAKPQLVYFPARGRGEAIRLILSEKNVEYEEVDCGPWDNWVNNWKSKMAFGQAPFYKDEEVELVQSNAILRHLGRKYNLYGDNRKEAARVDMINAGVEDCRVAYVRMIYLDYENGKDPYIKELPQKLQPFEALLKDSTGYILGDKTSFADYNLFDLLDIHLTLAPTSLDEFPTLKAYYNRVLQREGVQKRRKTDSFKNMNINGNGKQ